MSWLLARFPALETFRFAAPWLLLLLALLPLWMLLRGRFAQVAAVQFSSGQLLARASRRTRGGPGRFLAGLRYLALGLLIISLVRPQVDKGLSEKEALGINIMFVLDFSGTMKTKDFTLENKRISRAEAMKRVVGEFIKARESDRIGAVYFNSGAHLISPLTLDHEWLQSQLALEEPTQGTAPGSGMLIASESLVPAKNQTKVIITVTDADQVNDGPDPLLVAKSIAPLGIKNHVIQMVNTAHAQDYAASGEMLNEVARVTGGKFYKVSDYAALREVYRQIDGLEKAAFKERKQKAWEDLFPWFGAGALGLLTLEFLLARTIWRRLP